MSFLLLRAVRKRYGAVEALAGIDLSVAAGSRTAIVGPSGSGKTTLLRIIAGFEAPDAGSLELDGQMLAEGAESVPPHRRGIGIVAQDGALFPHLSIADNIGFGLDRNEKGRAERIKDLIGMVGLDTGMLARKPDQLSGGQQQRVALARALARKPRLMLLDEPFSALDTGLRASTRKAVADLLSAEGITSILVTHDQAEALSFADQVAVMRDGSFPQVGTPRELYQRPVDAMVAEFLGDAVIVPATVEDGWAQSPLGRVSVANGHASGATSIMIRPEQVFLTRLSPADLAAKSADEAVAEVIEIDFGGSVCTLVMRLKGHSEGIPGATIALRRSGAEIFAAGDLVRVAVAGEAHVFNGR
jgi:iron(III) transport system ATP-binding protein